MPSLFINKNIQSNTTNNSLPINNTYADAILRTFASLKPPFSTTLPTVINDSINDPLNLTEPSSLSSSLSSINDNQFTLEAHLPLATNQSEKLKKFHRLLSRLDKIYNKKKSMSTKTLLPSTSSHITDRYFFRSHSNDTTKYTKLSSSKNKSDNTPPSLRKRYKFSSNNNDQINNNNIYKFPTNHRNEQRSYSSDADRYFFPLDNSIKTSQKISTYIRSNNSIEQRSVTFSEKTSTIISDTPYRFSKTIDTHKYPNTTLTFIHPQDTWTYQPQQSLKIRDNIADSSLRTSNISTEYRQPTRMDTVTSTNGSLSIIKQPLMDKLTTVHFEQPTLSSIARSYLNEARERLLIKRRAQSPESFEKSVDRLVSSVNKKYRQQQHQSQIVSSSPSSSYNYISQYYAKEDQPFSDYQIDTDDEQQKFYYSLNTNRTHTQIMKNVNKSLIDRNYQINKNRLKHFEQNVRRYLRLYENQSLQRELNYNLVRCFSSTYLEDLRREEIRQIQTRTYMRSYTYEDIQDIYIPSILELYKMKTAIDRERQHRLHSSIITEQLSPVSSTGYSPIMIGSLYENMDTQSGGFETDRKSYTSVSQTPTNLRPSVDLFYEIMQESFRGVDASIAGHVSKASQFTKQKSYQTHKKLHDNDSDIDIKSNSSFWSDEETDQHIEDSNQRKLIPNQRKISRYLSTVNRSLLDRPSDLIADFYLSQLNRNMQESVRHIEIIARDKAYKQEFINNRNQKLYRSLSAEHLYQVRKEHLRYKQPFTTPTSFTTEDVADIYKPFVLENYKRKIAIELERRRRERQEQSIVNPPIHTSEIDFSNNILKSCQRSRIRNDFLVVSSPVVIQTNEIIMGRARRTITDDDNVDVVHHIGIVSPPPLYSIFNQPSSQTRVTLTATINDQYDIPYVTTVNSSDIIDHKQMYIRSERDHNDEMIDGPLSTSKQVITSHSSSINPYRRQTKIYTYIPQINTTEICQANRIESDSDNHQLSTVNITPIIALNKFEINELNLISQQTQPLQIPSDNYQHAMIIISPDEPLSLVDQLYNEQIIQYTEQEPTHEHVKFILPIEEYIAKIQEDISIYEILQTSNHTLPSTTQVNEIIDDNKISLNISKINEQPIIYNSLCNYQLEHTKNIDDEIPEYKKATITSDISYANSFVEPPINQSFNDFIPLASLLEELSTAVDKQHAKQIIDENYCWKTCEKFEESTRIPIIVYDTEWNDENIEINSNEFQLNIQNAQHKYSNNIEYEQVKINLPEQFINKSFEIEQIIDNNEQVKTLSDDSYLIQHQQQSNIHIDERPYLENPLHSTSILTLNYAHHNTKKSRKKFRQHDFSTISSNHIDNDSLTSSFIDMEIFLNHFEESLDHEQHLPLINQISLSYATSIIERYEKKNRSLPIEWYKPTILLHDEQLVEQWTVEKDIDTIQQEGTLHRQHKELLTNTQCENIIVIPTTNILCINEKLNSSSPIDLQENNYITDIASHYSPTSDYETDSLDKDNDTATSIINNTVIIPVTPIANILPSSSITTTTLLSQSSPPLTSYTAPVVPIIYFLDALAIEQKEINNPTKDFLLTIGFGQNKMNEITNIVSTIGQPLRPTWRNRRSNNIENLPTIIHQEKEIFHPQIDKQIHFATENKIEEDDKALIIYPHRLQYGHDFGENIQGPLTVNFEAPSLYLPITNEIYTYQMSFHNEFSLFHPPDILPHILVAKFHEDEIHSPNEYQINQSEILNFPDIHDLSDSEEDIQTFSSKLDQPSYIDHYHIQPLHPFPETCYAEINQPKILVNNDIIPIETEDEYDINQYDSIELKQENIDNNQIEYKYSQLNLPTSTSEEEEESKSKQKEKK